MKKAYQVAFACLEEAAKAEDKAKTPGTVTLTYRERLSNSQGAVTQNHTARSRCTARPGRNPKSSPSASLASCVLALLLLLACSFFVQATADIDH